MHHSLSQNWFELEMNSKVASKPSGLLGPKDNMCVVQMLGPRAQSLSTAVVQFFTCSPQEQQWTLRGKIMIIL